MKNSQNQDIAIIGMAGLFPKAPDIRAFWSNILNKVDGVGEPDEQWVDEVFFDVESDEINRLYTRAGGFLKELSRFNPTAFKIMPVSLSCGEPDQFLALKLASDALADAGYEQGTFDAQNTGIILGHSIHVNRGNASGVQHGVILDQTLGLFKSLFPEMTPDQFKSIADILRSKLPTANVDAVPGLVPNMMTGRIANRLDLMGPNYIIDAACASAHVAVEQAMLELQAGRSEMMLTGGVNTSTSPLVYMIFCQLGALSRSSAIRPFDSRADGTLLGEGAGILLLKRADKALSDGNRIYAVIKGVGQSSDGRGRGLMAPRLEGELLAVQRAYEQTGIPPESIGLLEAHGTGIPLGDQTEIEALMQGMGQRNGKYPRCAIGSVKSMIGHCIPAAGSAGLIKAALALHHGVLPPTICGEVNPELGLDRTPFYVNTEVRPWIHAGNYPRRAGINAFGFGGINSHAILEEAPVAKAGEGFGLFSQCTLTEERPAELVVLAGNDLAILRDKLSALRKSLADDQGANLREVAGRSWHSEKEGTHRLALLATSLDDLWKKAEQASTKLSEGNRPSFKTRKGIQYQSRPPEGKLAFLFPGEGSQYPGMLSTLAVNYPEIRGWFDFLDRLFGRDREVLPSHAIFSLPNCISDEARKALEDALHGMDLGSESVFVANQAINGLLQTLGIRPQVMVGHSTGETSALVASGIPQMTREMVGRYIFEMNRLYEQLKDSGDIPGGTLLSVGGVERERMDELLASDDRLHMTMDNCLHQVIIYGPVESVNKILPALKEAGGICLELPFGRAYHTVYMEPMAQAFSDLFQDIVLAPNGITLYSCATKEPFPDSVEGFSRLIKLQYTSRVHFRETIERMHDDGVRYFVEAGPNGHLTSFVRDILGEREHVAVAANLQRRDDYTQLLQLMATLFVHGQPLEPHLLYPEPAETGSRKKPQPTAPLPSEIPFIKLNEEETDQIRSMISSSPAPAAAGEPSTPAAATGRPAPAVHSQPTITDPRRAHTVKEHFQLMDNFLEQQGRIHSTDAARTSGPLPVTTERFSNEWPGLFPLPFAAVLRHVSPVTGRALEQQLGSPQGRQFLARLLGPAETEQWPPATNPRRCTDWLAGRLAAKEAVSQWLAENGSASPELRAIEVIPDPNGRPLVSGNWSNHSDGPPVISLAHIQGAAVAIAAPAGRMVGIDLEQEGRIRIDRDHFAELVFTPGEQGTLPQDKGWQQQALILWTAKEAAAKALGIGLALSPLAFEVGDLDRANQQAVVRYQEMNLRVHWRLVENYICTVAHN